MNYEKLQFEREIIDVFISEKHILWIHFGENFIDIWGGADFGPYSSQSFSPSHRYSHGNIEILLPA